MSPRPAPPATTAGRRNRCACRGSIRTWRAAGTQAGRCRSARALAHDFSGLDRGRCCGRRATSISARPTVATVTLSDGNVITVTGAAVPATSTGFRLQASKDAALNAKTAGRAFEIAGYRFDAIFRPLGTIARAEAAARANPPRPRAAQTARPHVQRQETGARAEAVTSGTQRRIRASPGSAGLRQRAVGRSARGIHLGRRFPEPSASPSSPQRQAPGSMSIGRASSA